MELLIGLALAVAGVVMIVICLIAIRGRRQRRRTQIAGSHDLGAHVDEDAWAEIVKQLKKDRIRDEPDDGSRAGGQR